jgi:hypothetical protein
VVEQQLVTDVELQQGLGVLFLLSSFSSPFSTFLFSVC